MRSLGTATPLVEASDVSSRVEGTNRKSRNSPKESNILDPIRGESWTSLLLNPMSGGETYGNGPQ